MNMKPRPGKVIRTVYATETPGRKESTEIITHEKYKELVDEKKVSQENLNTDPVASAENPEEKKASANRNYVAFPHEPESGDKLPEAKTVPAPQPPDKEVGQVMKGVRRKKKKKSENDVEKRPVTPQCPDPGVGGDGGTLAPGPGPGSAPADPEPAGPAIVSPLGKLIEKPVRCILEIQRDSKRRANKIVPYWLRARERKLLAKRKAAS